ncbi:MAG: hypothetical protein JNM27_21325 [Leptospirales bacterium]|nr:hypothetical protein [Leptospirales bacterium]
MNIYKSPNAALPDSTSGPNIARRRSFVLVAIVSASLVLLVLFFLVLRHEVANQRLSRGQFTAYLVLLQIPAGAIGLMSVAGLHQSIRALTGSGKANVRIVGALAFFSVIVIGFTLILTGFVPI